MLSFRLKERNDSEQGKVLNMNPQDILKRLEGVYKQYEVGDYETLPSLRQMYEMVSPYTTTQLTQKELNIKGKTISRLAKALDDSESLIEQRIQVKEKIDLLQHKIKTKLGDYRGQQLSNLLYYVVDNTGCIGNLDYYEMKMAFYEEETTYGDFIQKWQEELKHLIQSS